MKRVYYNKLIRDLVKEKIEKKGEACSVRSIEDEQEFEQELLKKVMEEASALAHARSKDAFLDEYADLMIVLDALTEKLEFSPADIKVALEENLKRKGKYDNRYFLHWSEDAGYSSNESAQGLSES